MRSRTQEPVPSRAAGLRRTCDFCIKRKRKCSGLQPCSLCVRCKEPCNFGKSLRRGPKGKHPDDAELRDTAGWDGAANAAAVATAAAGQWGFGDGGGGGGGGGQLQWSAATLPRHPAIHSGQLLGAKERKYLEVYLLAYMGLGMVHESQLQRTAMRLLTHGRDGLSIALAADADAAADDASAQRRRVADAAANECVLLATIAKGSVLCRPAEAAEAQRYIDCARAAAARCRSAAAGEPLLEVLRAHISLAWAHVLVEDYAGFFAYYHCAADLAAAILRAHAAAKAAAHGARPAAGTPCLDEEAWIWVEALGVVKNYVISFLDSDAQWKAFVQRRLLQHFSSSRLADIGDAGSGMQGYHHSAPGMILMCFAPRLPGLPEPAASRDDRPGGIAAMKAAEAQLPRHAMVTSALTVLAQPQLQCVSELVATASKGCTRLHPLLLGVDMKVAQLMMMIHALPRGADLAAPREAGARLQHIVERLVEVMDGAAFLAQPSIVHKCMAYELIFLRLLAGDEEGSLHMLRHLSRMLTHAPGIQRSATMRHNIHWLAALLLNAGLHVEYMELARACNSIGLAGGRDALPLDEAGQAHLCLCSEFHCAAVHRVVADLHARGAARIFTRRTQRDLPAAALSSIDLGTQPSQLYMTWCGRAPKGILWERATAGVAAMGGGIGEPGVAAAAAAAAAVAAVSAGGDSSGSGGSSGDGGSPEPPSLSSSSSSSGSCSGADSVDSQHLAPAAAADRRGDTHEASACAPQQPRPQRAQAAAAAAQAAQPQLVEGDLEPAEGEGSSAVMRAVSISPDGSAPPAAVGGSSGSSGGISGSSGGGGTWLVDVCLGALAGSGADAGISSGFTGSGAEACGAALTHGGDAAAAAASLGAEDIAVDEGLLAQLAAELDDESLLSMADACFPEPVVAAAAAQEQQWQQGQQGQQEHWQQRQQWQQAQQWQEGQQWWRQQQQQQMQNVQKYQQQQQQRAQSWQPQPPPPMHPPSGLGMRYHEPASCRQSAAKAYQQHGAPHAWDEPSVSLTNSAYAYDMYGSVGRDSGAPQSVASPYAQPPFGSAALEQPFFNEAPDPRRAAAPPAPPHQQLRPDVFYSGGAATFDDVIGSAGLAAAASGLAQLRALSAAPRCAAPRVAGPDDAPDAGAVDALPPLAAPQPLAAPRPLQQRQPPPAAQRSGGGDSPLSAPDVNQV